MGTPVNDPRKENGQMKSDSVEKNVDLSASDETYDDDEVIFPTSKQAEATAKTDSFESSVADEKSGSPRGPSPVNNASGSTISTSSPMQGRCVRTRKRPRATSDTSAHQTE